MRKEPSTYDREVGRRVRARRLELNASQTELGNALGLTFQQIQKYEKGVNRISAGRLQFIAQVLKVPVTFFYGDAGAEATSEISTLIDSSYSLRLVKAFARIPDRALQRSMVELVEALAEATAKKTN